MKRLPAWFWEMQRGYRAYFTQRPEDGLAHWKARLRTVYQSLLARYVEGGREDLEDWLERAYVVEAAILAANLNELRSAPGRRQRVRLYHEYRALFHEIRNYLPNGAVKKDVIEKLERAFRAAHADIT